MSTLPAHVAEVCARIEAGEPPTAIVAHVLAQPARVMIALSHEIEDRAFDGTPYAAVFDILCNGAACDALMPEAA